MPNREQLMEPDASLDYEARPDLGDHEHVLTPEEQDDYMSRLGDVQSVVVGEDNPSPTSSTPAEEFKAPESGKILVAGKDGKVKGEILVSGDNDKDAQEAARDMTRVEANGSPTYKYGESADEAKAEAEELAKEAEAKDRNKSVADMLRAINVIHLKEKIDHATGKALDEQPNRFDVKLPEHAEADAKLSKEVRDKLIEDYIQTGKEDGSRVISDKARKKLEDMLDLSYDELEALIEEESGKPKNPDAGKSPIDWKASAEAGGPEIPSWDDWMNPENTPDDDGGNGNGNGGGGGGGRPTPTPTPTPTPPKPPRPPRPPRPPKTPTTPEAGGEDDQKPSIWERVKKSKGAKIAAGVLAVGLVAGAAFGLGNRSNESSPVADEAPVEQVVDGPSWLEGPMEVLENYKALGEYLQGVQAVENWANADHAAAREAGYTGPFPVDITHESFGHTDAKDGLLDQAIQYAQKVEQAQNNQ